MSISYFGQSCVSPHMSAAKINFQYLEVDLERLVRIVANTDAFNNIFKGKEKMAIKGFIDEIEMLYNIIVNSVTPFYQLSEEGLFKTQFPKMFSNFSKCKVEA